MKGYFIRGRSWSMTWGKKEEVQVGLLEGGTMGMGWQRGRKEAVAEVPKGCLAVYVGEDLRRFVIPASYLSQPVFVELMEKAAQEFGFQQTGALKIPCHEDVFQDILAVLEDSAASNNKSKPKKRDKN